MNNLTGVLLCLVLSPFGSFVFAQESGRGGISGNYIIQPSDLIRMEVFQEPDMEQEIRVAADGTITLPLIGVVQVGGLSVNEAQRSIMELYDRDYLVDPHINLLVLQYTERRVEVLGMVNRPGSVLIPPEEEMTLTKAISGAGGHNRLADLTKVRLTRTDDLGRPVVKTYNFSKISKGRDKDIILQDGDSVFVDERVW